MHSRVRITGLDGHTLGQILRVPGARRTGQGGGVTPKEANDAAGEEQQPGGVSEVRDPTLGSLLVRGEVPRLPGRGQQIATARIGRRLAEIGRRIQLPDLSQHLPSHHSP